MCALALIAVGVASTALMRESWQLILLWGFVVGSGTGFLATVLAATVATRWFTARRGLVVGMLSGGSATGQLLFLPVLAAIASVYGWRATVLTVACVALGIMPFVAWLMRDRPSDMGLDALRRARRAQARPAAAGQSGADRVPRARRGGAGARLLAARRHVLRLRRLDQRADRHRT